ncbi:unnamed protein product [Paramecium sonneborni]|uniref:Uncharacterized protein n=1 Tax=Paramecium sonneborni TaxID=65129 RepID=A0A8S1QS81_9CILI|nr:unnamed protein product [Paramecium sonneborni]
MYFNELILKMIYETLIILYNIQYLKKILNKKLQLQLKFIIIGLLNQQIKQIHTYTLIKFLEKKFQEQNQVYLQKYEQKISMIKQRINYLMGVQHLQVIIPKFYKEPPNFWNYILNLKQYPQLIQLFNLYLIIFKLQKIQTLKDSFYINLMLLLKKLNKILFLIYSKLRNRQNFIKKQKFFYPAFQLNKFKLKVHLKQLIFDVTEIDKNEFIIQILDISGIVVIFSGIRLMKYSIFKLLMQRSLQKNLIYLFQVTHPSFLLRNHFILKKFFRVYVCFQQLIRLDLMEQEQCLFIILILLQNSQQIIMGFEKLSDIILVTTLFLYHIRIKIKFLFGINKMNIDQQGCSRSSTFQYHCKKWLQFKLNKLYHQLLY